MFDMRKCCKSYLDMLDELAKNPLTEAILEIHLENGKKVSVMVRIDCQESESRLYLVNCD
jgi:hypothetical protein